MPPQELAATGVDAFAADELLHDDPERTGDTDDEYDDDKGEGEDGNTDANEDEGESENDHGDEGAQRPAKRLRNIRGQAVPQRGGDG